MLESIRKKKDNIVYTIIILAVVAVMAMYGVGKLGDNESGAGAAAWVNGELITAREFRQELERKMVQYQAILGAQYDERILGNLLPQRTLNELIQYKLLAQLAQKMKIVVPDSELADHIRSLPYYQKNGKFDAETYAKIPGRGIEEKWQRERLQISKLERYLTDRIRPTPADVRAAFLLRDTKVRLLYAKIDFPSLAESQKKPNDQEIDEFIKKTSEAELQTFYNSHRKDFTEPASVNFRQIRVAIPYQAAEDVISEAKRKAEEIAKEVTPEKFSDVARKKSDDEYAKRGGGVGWVQRNTLDPALEAALDKLDPGKIGGPVETSLGFFLVQLLEKKDEVAHSFSDVKRRVASMLMLENFKKEFSEKKKAQWDKMLAEGKSIEPELKQLKVELKSTGPFPIGQGFVPNIGQDDGILDGVFSLSSDAPLAKRLFPVRDLYFFIKLEGIEPAKESDFAINEAFIDKGLSTSLQGELMNQLVSSLQKNASIKTEFKFD